MRVTDIDLLRRLPALAELPRDAIDRLLDAGMVQTLPRGAILCEQGQPAEYLHIILRGRVILLGQTADQTETVVDLFEAGDILVAPAVMLNLPYLMSARVAIESRILFVPAEAVRRMLQRDAAFSYAMAMQLARYWRRLVRQIKDLKLRSSSERLAGYLVALAPGVDGAATVELPEDRKVVAARLGMTPENLSRAFASLRALGVGGQGRSVTIEDLARLRGYSQFDDEA